ncbi:extracellular solute-binding protein [Rathayibacter sp. VKM Ac-2630]|uniref:extracellular solute-binding protein n=1 Tax=Rathayibacter sp. VKM Ac-2630 TaxID=1938617 RepID=UPI0022A9A944|nr:extracellular solute-binding protein [Rathayibacter sp. VKM Ac-2630]
MPRLLRSAAVPAFALTTLLLAGCSGGAESAESAPASDSAARPATITLYTSEPQEKADALVAAFNEEHPEITVEVFRAGTGDLTARIESERTAGAVQADVLLAADAGTFEDYAAEDLLLQYSPADVDALNPDASTPRATTRAPGSSRPSSPTTPVSSRRPTPPSRGPTSPTRPTPTAS